MKTLVSVIGAKKVIDILNGMQDRAKNPRESFFAIADEFAKHEGTVFNQQGAVEGFAGWAPLSPNYVAEKAAEGYGSRILIRTGKLRMSLTDKTDANFVFRLTPKRLVIGTSVPYAKFHRRGTSNMPAREPIRITQALRKRWSEIMRNFVIFARKG